ncbi:glycosyltransferase family 22 protein, partial [Mycena olivaceomarginata]
MSLALDALILATGWTHVLLAPYTKVEESFNLHAVHDVLMYGVAPSSLPNYDHFVFAGAVPPAIYLASSFGLVPSKFELQVIGLYYTLITCSQFHVPFWMGRTLPNMFALKFVRVLADRRAPNTLKPSQRSVIVSIASLVFSAVVFVLKLRRSLELWSCSQYSGHITFWRAFTVGAISSLASIAFTVSVDSYFWGQPYLWPEWHSIYFNVVEGKSADWGTSPAHAYLIAPAQTATFCATSIAICGLLVFPERLVSLRPGHKEWRFIVYIVPVWNVVAARGMSAMVSQRKSSSSAACSSRRLWRAPRQPRCHRPPHRRGCATTPAATPWRSSTPAPGPVNAHIANLALQSGASLFTTCTRRRIPRSSRVVVVEHLVGVRQDGQPASFTGYTHLVAESGTPLAAGSGGDGAEAGWTELGSVAGFERWALDLGLLRQGEEGAG